MKKLSLLLVQGVLLTIMLSPFAMDAHAGAALCTSSPCFQGNSGDPVGIAEAADVRTGSNESNIGAMAVKILRGIIKYVGIFAVAIIIIAGLMLILSGGNDDMRDRARKMIIYVGIGMLIIIFAAAIVTFFITITT